MSNSEENIQGIEDRLQSLEQGLRAATKERCQLEHELGARVETLETELYSLKEKLEDEIKRTSLNSREMSGTHPGLFACLQHTNYSRNLIFSTTRRHRHPPSSGSGYSTPEERTQAELEGSTILPGEAQQGGRYPSPRIRWMRRPPLTKEDAVDKETPQ